MISSLRLLLVTVLTLFAIGCSSTYKHSELQPIETNLDSRKGVLISTPKDGWYGNTQYRDSGRMTASAVRAAFSKHASSVDLISNCHGDDCLDTIDVEKYGYYVKPEILHWEDRATEWSGKSDRIEIQLVIFNAVTKEELANSSYTGTSKWATFGGDHPQDLLPESTYQYVNRLYQ
jgi:hypothetical protein